MRRTREQSEIASKLKEMQLEQNLLTDRNTYLTSLLRQQWENYSKTRFPEDLMLLITILQEVNRVQEQLKILSSNQSIYEKQWSQKTVKSSAKAASDRLKAVAMELRALNKRRKEAEKVEAAAIQRCAPVIEFMDLNDVYQMIQYKIEVLTAEKKSLRQLLKKPL